MKNNNNEFSIEELEEQYKKMTEQCNSIGEQLKQKKQEEADKKKAQLASEKEIRKKEIETKDKELRALIKAYIKDYGSYSATRSYNNQNEDGFPYLWHMFF